MFQLSNYTDFKVERSLLLDRQGSQVWVIIIKGTYEVLFNSNKLKFSETQEKVNLSHIYLGEPGMSHMLRESEMIPEHCGTDLTLNASAYSPSGKESSRVFIEVTLGSIKKTIAVTGDRRWERSGYDSIRAGKPIPFRSMPITWDRAYGGAVKTADGNIEAWDDRNPIGCGLLTSKGQLDGNPLPNIENPQTLIEHPNTNPSPTGLSAIPPNWMPRKHFAGTFDANWMRNRMPICPDDFDPRHYNSAPSDLISDPPLNGGETVCLKNVTESGELSFRLPRAFFMVDTFITGSRIRQSVQLDRVIIEPSINKLVMVWRSSLNCGTRARLIKKSIVDIKAVLL